MTRAWIWLALGAALGFVAPPVQAAPSKGEVCGRACLGRLLDGYLTAVVALRLHETAGKVDEAEWNIARASDPAVSEGQKPMFDAPTLLADPPPGPNPPAGERLTHDQLIAVANSYFDGITSANPRIIMAHPGCKRLENGLKTTGHPLPAGRESEGPGGG